jgi:hypothetical protein
MGNGSLKRSVARFVVAASLVAIAELLAISSLALATTPTRIRPTVLRWHKETQGTALVSDADSVWTGPGTGVGLINGTNDVRTLITLPADCSLGPSGGGPFLVWGCVDGSAAASGLMFSAFLDDTGSGQVKTPDPTELDAVCGQNPSVFCTPFSVGSDWIGWNVMTGRVASQAFFQSIASGAMVRAEVDPGGRIWDNPNTEGLAHRLCLPLRVPTGAVTAQPIRFFGRFATLLESGIGTAAYYLEECGSNLRELISAEDHSVLPVGNNHVIAWLSSSSTISYIRLPSLARGSWKLPASLVSDYSVLEIAGTRLFLSERPDCALTSCDLSQIFSAQLPGFAR